MAATLTQQGPASVPGNWTRKLFTVVGDSSYPNPAGYVLTPASFGFSVLRKVADPIASTVAAGAWDPVIVPTYANDGSGAITSVALHLIVNTTGVEVANGVNVSTANFSLWVEGN